MNLHQNFTLIIIKSAITELLYCGYLYELKIAENKEEIQKLKSILMNYYVAKETEWRDTVKYLINYRNIKLINL